MLKLALAAVALVGGGFLLFVLRKRVALALKVALVGYFCLVVVRLVLAANDAEALVGLGVACGICVGVVAALILAARVVEWHQERRRRVDGR